jgi:EAL domain-containing protein (putative c-di-GMP-specific phosphodiesterase class I)
VVDRIGIEEAIRRAADPTVLMQRVVDEVMTLIEGVDGVLVGFVHDREWMSFECGAGCSEAMIDRSVPVMGSIAGLAYRGGETLRSGDARSDPRANLDIVRTTGHRSLVCVPLWRRGETVGVLHVASLNPGAFDDRDVATLASLGEFVSAVLTVAFDLASATDALLSRGQQDAPGAEVAEEDDRDAEERFVANVLDPGATRLVESRNQINGFLKGRGLSHVFQPIYDLTSGECFAVEALARFEGPPLRSPDFWFAAAHEIGLGVELELISVRQALRCLDSLPPEIDLCVNAGPETMVSEGLHELLAGSKPGRIIMELTEETRVDDYSKLSATLDRLYPMGVRLAIDDAGAGYASLAHILKLTPDIIKLDRELTHDIDRDPIRYTLAAALVSFAKGLGAQIVAEGVETEAELEKLCDLGIRFGQGFYLSRPTSLRAFATRLSRELRSPTRPLSRRAGLGQLVAFPTRR